MNDCSERAFQETAKIHELLCHVSKQVRENGPSGNFSSDIMEWTHPLNKGFLRRGSQRLSDQSTTVLEQNFFAAVGKDARRENVYFDSDRVMAPIDTEPRFFAGTACRRDNKAEEYDHIHLRGTAHIVDDKSLLPPIGFGERDVRKSYSLEQSAGRYGNGLRRRYSLFFAMNEMSAISYMLATSFAYSSQQVLGWIALCDHDKSFWKYRCYWRLRALSI